MSLKNKLNRLKPHLSGGGPSEKIDIPPQAANIEVPFKEKWEQANVFPYFLDENYCLIREVKYPLSHQHGNYCFRDFLTAVEIWNKQPVNHPLSSVGHQADK